MEQKLRWELVNTGKDPITVAGAGQLQMSETDKGVTVLRLVVELRADEEKVKVVPSESDLRIVKLNQNEAVRLIFEAEGAPARFLAAELAPSELDKDIDKRGPYEVEYVVSEEVGKRFGVWHGKVTTKTHIIRK